MHLILRRIDVNLLSSTGRILCLEFLRRSFLLFFLLFFFLFLLLLRWWMLLFLFVLFIFVLFIFVRGRLNLANEVE